MKIAVTCGGTGGHMFPGLAAATAFKKLGHPTSIILSGRNVETINPLDWDGETLNVPFPQPRWRNPIYATQSLLNLLKAFFKARKVLRSLKPDALLAMGSYTSIPTGLAARSLGIPLVLHEANAVPGKAITFLSRFASCVCVAFDNAIPHFHKKTNIINTGLPLRTHITQCSKHLSQSNRFTLLVMGGSQGAQAINKLFADAIKILDGDPELSPKIHLVHLAGTRNEVDVRESYATIQNIPIEVIGFSNEMQKLYASADFCFSRAGAASCFELVQCELPAALIPLKGLANDHQVANAQAMQSLCGIDHLPQSSLTPEILVNYIRSLISTPEHRETIRAAMHAIPKQDAAQALTQAVLSVHKV